MCRTYTWGCIQDDKGVSSYIGMIVYKMIKVCRHTWGCIQDDKGVSSYMGIIQDDKGVSSYMGIYTR